MNLTLETPNTKMSNSDKQEVSPNAFPTTMPPLQSPPVSLASPDSFFQTTTTTTTTTANATTSATADATATADDPKNSPAAVAAPSRSKNDQVGPSRNRRKSPKGRRSSPRNNTSSSLSPSRKEMASPSSSPSSSSAKRSDGMKQSPEEQHLPRGGANRTMAEGRRVMVAHEVAAAKHREKVRIRRCRHTVFWMERDLRDANIKDAYEVKRELSKFKIHFSAYLNLFDLSLFVLH